MSGADIDLERNVECLELLGSFSPDVQVGVTPYDDADDRLHNFTLQG